MILENPFHTNFIRTIYNEQNRRLHVIEDEIKEIQHFMDVSLFFFSSFLFKNLLNIILLGKYNMSRTMGHDFTERRQFINTESSNQLYK